MATLKVIQVEQINGRNLLTVERTSKNFLLRTIRKTFQCVDSMDIFVRHGTTVWYHYPSFEAIKPLHDYELYEFLQQWQRRNEFERYGA